MSILLSILSFFTSKIGRIVGLVGMALGVLGAIYLKGRRDADNSARMKRYEAEVKAHELRNEVELEVGNLDSASRAERLRRWLVE